MPLNMTGHAARKSDEQPPLRDLRRGMAVAPVAKPDEPVVVRQSKPTKLRSDLSLFHKSWELMAPVVAGGAVLTGLATFTWPSVIAAGLIVAAVALVAATRIILRLEQQRGNDHGIAKRLTALMLAVSLPMLLYGIAIASWTEAAAASSWESSMGVLVLVGTVGMVLLKRRLISMIVSQVSLWSGVALVSGNIATFAVLAVGIGAGIFAALRQARIDAGVRQTKNEQFRTQMRAEKLLEEFEQTGHGWFWETDRRGAITYVSPSVGKALGRSSHVLVGRPFTELFDLGASGQEGERTLPFHLTARSSFQELAVRVATEAEERWWSINGRPIYDAYKNFTGFRGSGSDLTEKRRSQEDATRLARYDSLTGLANRLQMAQTLEKILNAPHLDQRACAVFLLDLDRFKQVNDTMGHPVGDALLKQVAQRLEGTVGKHGRVGRLGGDEFEVILAGRHRVDDLAELAERIIVNLSLPYAIEGHRVVIGASVGIARTPEDGNSAENLIRNADLALYAAKDGGRGRHHFYAADLHSEAEERRQLEQDLRDALTNGGLEMHYQPVVHTTTEKITGFEALMRWNHPTKGPLSPAKFIPIAEDTGLIAQLGEWALRTACADLARWPGNVRVAVNVSPLQFSNPALPSIVTNALAAAQIDPARLELEITESVFLNDDAGTEAMFTALKRVGVRLALDDFGTGYSSLGYLKKAPFDKIKIDQSFVRGATINGSRNGAIISSIVSLAEALGMETTAEGVETLDELDLVRVLGCSHVQGYIYEKPMNAAQAMQQITSGMTAIARGPKSARAVRQTMLRKVVLDHGGQHYHGTIRNISATGAMIEGLWSVPSGTIFRVFLAEGQVVTATARWCQEDRMGVEFARALSLDETGRVDVSGQAHNPGMSLMGARSDLRREA